MRACLEQQVGFSTLIHGRELAATLPVISSGNPYFFTSRILCGHVPAVILAITPRCRHQDGTHKNLSDQVIG